VNPGSSLSFLRQRAPLLLTAALLLQAVFLYGFTRSEITPEHQTLSTLPLQFEDWTLQEENKITEETQAVLRADDLLSRTYVSPSKRTGANLFVAFFSSQRTGQTPHSPKNCLPGSGWVPILSDTLQISLPGRTLPAEVNRYVVQKGDNKSLVLYWYQSRDRIVAREYAAKFFVIADALRYNRTDTALVRIVVPFGQSVTMEDASRNAQEFIQSMYPVLRRHFPA